MALDLIHRFVVPAVALILIAAASSGLRGADPAFVGQLSLLADEDVATELKLATEVREKIAQLIEQRENDVQELALEIKDLPLAERTARLAPFVAESEKLGLALLTDEQKKRLNQLRISRTGWTTLGEPEVAAQLGITGEQSDKVNKLLADMAAETSSKSGLEQLRAKARYERELKALLSKEQQAKWETLAGRPVTPATAGAAAPAENATPRGDDEPDAGNPAAAADSAKPITNLEDVRLRFNFSTAPWKDVIDWFAKEAELSLQVPSGYPAGTFNYRDNKAYTLREAMDVMNRSLSSFHGHLLVRRERLLVVWNIADEAIPHDWLPPISPAELDEFGEFELVRCLFEVKNMTPEEAEAEANKLKGSLGTVVLLSKPRQLYVTDLAGKVRAIRDVIDPQVDPSDLPQLAVIPLGSIDATTAQNVVTSLLANRTPPVQMSVDPVTNNLIARASHKDLDVIKTTLEQLQRDGRQMKVFKLKKLDPSEAMLAINNIFGSFTNPPKIHADSTNFSLVVMGTKSQLEQIESYLGDMGEMVGPPKPGAEVVKSTMRVIPLPARTSRKLGETAEQVQALVSGIIPNKVRIVMPNHGADGTRPAESFVMPRTDSARKPSTAAQNSSDDDSRRDYGRGFGPGFGGPGFGPGFGQGFGPGGFGGDGERGRDRDRDRDRDDRDRDRDGDRDRDRDRDDRSTHLHPGYPLRVLPLEYVAVVEEGDSPPAAESAAQEAAPKAQPAPTPQLAAGEDSPASPQDQSQQPLDDNEVVIVITPTSWIIRSNDTAALDRIEESLTALIPPVGTKEFSVFYLKYARAEIAAALLNSVLTGAPVSDGGGSLAGDIAAGMMGNMMGGMFGNMFGGGGGGSGFSAVTTNGNVSVIADPRLNALYVQASASDLDTVEKLLQLIDQAESPDPPQTVREPRAIPVRYANVDEVATVVRQVYSNRIASEGGQRQISPEDFIRQAFGRSRGGRGGSQQQQQGEEQKMTIGVDTASNTLFVAAPDYLFEEVKNLVAQLDSARSEQEETVSVVKLDRANPDVVARSLSTVLGQTVNSNRTSSSSNRSSSSSSSRSGGNDSSRSSSGREFSGFGGGFPGGGFPGGGSGFSGSNFGGGFSRFGGDRGSRGGFEGFSGDRGSRGSFGGFGGSGFPGGFGGDSGRSRRGR